MDFVDVDDFVTLFPNEKVTEKKLMTLGILRRERQCEKCSEQMTIVEREKRLIFRCGRRECGKIDVSVRKGSVFYGSRLSCRKILKVVRAWLQGESRDAAVRSSKVNKESVSEWYLTFRELVAISLRETKEKIGGHGVIVQVDETKLGKRKFHRGHRVEGVWVVCGIEMKTDGRAFCVQVEKRDAETLEGVVRENVAEGSEVWTDGWKGYNGVRDSLQCNS